ncbi:MAG: polyprenol monophosphomannose synthase [Bacteroidales bacterium]|nr:polyprenol monophosphomannose synthase [Bacteroidales bacterium]MBQ5639881.1 polyprenol monophosphomannose synthase [Bacteroidales bacterium]
MGAKLIIIPTYNEIENIFKIIPAVLEKDENFEILIIDDGSPDGTADAVKQMQKNHKERLHLIQRSGKLGLGTAYVAGFKWALERDYSHIFEMDADFSHNPDDLPRLLSECTEKGADMSVGSRYCNGINVVNWPLTRILISYCASIYVRTVLGFKIYDSTAGFVCYSRRVLETIDLDAVKMKGYGFQIELKYTAHKLGFKIGEVPVIFVNRQEGTSKMSGSIFGEAFWGVLALRFRKLLPRR